MFSRSADISCVVGLVIGATLRVCRSRLRGRIQRLTQIGDQIPHVLDTHGEPQQRVGDAAAFALLLRDRIVRNACGGLIGDLTSPSESARLKSFSCVKAVARSTGAAGTREAMPPR